MQLFVTILHIFLCVSLILIILLQPGKEGAAAFGGGGANQMYGPRGQGHFLGRATTVVAALFMFTSITLAWFSSERAASDSDLEEGIDQLEGEEEAGFEISTPAPTPPVPPSPQPTEGTTPEGSAQPSEGAAPEGSALEQLGGDQGIGDMPAEGAGDMPAAAPTGDGAPQGAGAP